MESSSKAHKKSQLPSGSWLLVLYGRRKDSPKEATQTGGLAPLELVGRQMLRQGTNSQ
jgi:hypothetical protein